MKESTRRRLAAVSDALAVLSGVCGCASDDTAFSLAMLAACLGFFAAARAIAGERR